MSATNLGLSFLSAVASAYGVSITDTKFYTASQTLVPSGTVVMYGVATAPAGWLLCDGSNVSRTTYASLFAAIGTTFGTGDGSTTFGLPDFRGIFPRGAGTNSKLTNANGTAFSGTLGNYGNDQFQGHYHQTLVPASAGTSSTWGLQFWSASRGLAFSTDGNPTIYLPITDGSHGTPRTGTENNPANLGITFIIAT